MRPPYTPPPIATRDIRGDIDLIESFTIALQLEPRVTERTVRGERIHQRILGGTITGPRFSGEVYPNGGGEFGVIRSDAVEEGFTRFMIRADNGEWLYAQAISYVRPDGYARFQATFDADSQGPHGWMNESMFLGTINQDGTGETRTLTFFEAA